MGAKQSSEMRHAIHLVSIGYSLTQAAREAEVTLSGLCKALKTQPNKKKLTTTNNSTKV